ncbi:MAG: hypothetical protein RLN62_02490 [Rickettsiales bacterium]
MDKVKFFARQTYKKPKVTSSLTLLPLNLISSLERSDYTTAYGQNSLNNIGVNSTPYPTTHSVEALFTIKSPNNISGALLELFSRVNLVTCFAQLNENLIDIRCAK